MDAITCMQLVEHFEHARAVVQRGWAVAERAGESISRRPIQYADLFKPRERRRWDVHTEFLRRSHPHQARSSGALAQYGAKSE